MPTTRHTVTAIAATILTGLSLSSHAVEGKGLENAIAKVGEQQALRPDNTGLQNASEHLQMNLEKHTMRKTIERPEGMTRPERPERPARPEMPTLPDKAMAHVQRPDRPERPARPEKP